MRLARSGKRVLGSSFLVKRTGPFLFLDVVKLMVVVNFLKNLINDEWHVGTQLRMQVPQTLLLMDSLKNL